MRTLDHYIQRHQAKRAQRAYAQLSPVLKLERAERIQEKSSIVRRLKAWAKWKEKMAFLHGILNEIAPQREVLFAKASFED